MADNQTTTQRRQPGRKAEDFRIAWKEQAPETTFGGKTLADLEADMEALEQAEETVNTAKIARAGAIRTRDEKKDLLTRTLRSIMRGVQSDPNHGEDGSLYRAMGFVPLSERKSGLTRKTSSGPPDGPTMDANAA